jgi:Tol biopolymer transport system component
MGALAFVDRRGVLVIMDRQGRKVQVKGTRGGIALPAWSPDGVSVAYLEKSGKGYDLKIVEVYPK